VGECRGIHQDVAGISVGSESERPDRLGGGLCRRNFRGGKNWGAKVGKTRKGKGTKIMMVTDGEGMPLAGHIESASPAEVRLVEKTLAMVSVGRAGEAGAPRRKPERLIADKAYDCNGLRKRLSKRGILPIIPARSTNQAALHQDGRLLRRYRRRWKIERTFAWLLSFRRITVRWERFDFMYAAFVHLACAFIVLRRL
jgi:transposase